MRKKLTTICATVLFIFLARIVSEAQQTIVVPAGGNVQAAINAAQCGDTIILQAGATYETPGDFTAYSLPNKGACFGYITITSSVAAPAGGVRVTLADRAKMPKLVVKKGSPFFQALAGANHYRLSNLWFTNKQGGTTTVLLDNNGADLKHPDPRDPLVDWPNNIIIDHCFFNPVEWDMYPEANLCSSVNTAIGLGGINVTIRDSVMKGFGAKYGSGAGANLPSCGSDLLDGQAVLMVTPPGPMLLDNNELEHWFTAFFIGGGDPGSMFGGKVLDSPAPTLTSATLDNVNGLSVGMGIAFEMNVESPAPANKGNTVGNGIVTGVSGNNITFTPLIGKWGGGASSVPITNARPKTIADPGGVAPCTVDFKQQPIWCSRAYWGGYNPSNITITHNDINKPRRWYDFAGGDGKGFFEIKLCDTCLIDGNKFNGNTGFTITVRNQGGRAPWSAIRNLTMSNNVATRFSAGWYTLFFDNEYLSTESTNINVDNNLLYGEFNNIAQSGFLPKVFSGYFGNGIRFRHNTVLQTGEIVRIGSGPEVAGIQTTKNFDWRDNITGWGVGEQNGYACMNGSTHQVCTPNYVWTKSVMIGAPTGPISERQSMASFPAGNFNPANIGAVGFTDPASGNFRLLPSSPFKNAASDGKDVGVDMDQLLAHLNGPIPIPSPTPTVAPTPVPSPIPNPSPQPTPSVTPTPQPTVSPTPPSGTVPIVRVLVREGETPVASAVVNVSGQERLSRAGDGYAWFDERPTPLGTVIVTTKAGYEFPRVTVVEGTVEQLYFVVGRQVTQPVPTPTPTPVSSPTPVPSPTATPVASPSPLPTPVPSPTVQPTPPPMACEMSLTVPTLMQWSTGVLRVGLTAPLPSVFTLTVTSDSGQITIIPRSQSFSNATSLTAEFKLQAKKKSASITVVGPCGPAKTVMVNVQ